MRAVIVFTALCSTFIPITAVPSAPLFLRGGSPSTTLIVNLCPESIMTAGTGTVCAKVKDGQTFVTWTDVATDLAGADWRYSMYRSNAPITEANYASASLIASHIFNNSGQLYGGDPDDRNANGFAGVYRQDPAHSMDVISDLGTPLTAFTGLQAYTALGSESAYYAIVANSCPGGICALSPNIYLGSVGPIAETVGTPAPIKWADSLNRGTSYGKFTGIDNLPVVIKVHGSSTNGSCLTQGCQQGDYWEFFLTAAGEGYQDGRATVFSAAQDGGTGGHNYPSLPTSIVIRPRDTIVDPRGVGISTIPNDPLASGIETYHVGMGLTPNPLVSVNPNRFFLTGQRMIEREARFAISYYHADPNAFHMTGQCMGGWGSSGAGLHATNPQMASIWPLYPLWRRDLAAASSWPGKVWSDDMPFRATVNTSAVGTLGTNASAVLMDDGSHWTDYYHAEEFIAASAAAETDLPFAAFSLGKYDGYATFIENINVTNALQSAHYGHAFAWSVMGHEGTDYPQKPLDCDFVPVDINVCYGKNLFKLNLPYIAFDHSSIDDLPGTATTDPSTGIFDGDDSGCINCGFRWVVSSDTSGAFNFTVNNTWMNRNPTPFPTAVTTSAIDLASSGTFTIDSSTGFSPAGNYYLLVDKEVIKINGIVGNIVTYTVRGDSAGFGTTRVSHPIGATVKQLTLTPTGPNHGPFTTMTANVTPRRIQNFVKGKTNGQVISCTITPFGGSPTVQTPAVVNAVFTLTDIIINEPGGVTTIACS